MILKLAMLEGVSLWAAICGSILFWTTPVAASWTDGATAVAKALAISLCCIVSFYYNDLYDLRIVRTPELLPQSELLLPELRGGGEVALAGVPLDDLAEARRDRCVRAFDVRHAVGEIGDQVGIGHPAGRGDQRRRALDRRSEGRQHHGQSDEHSGQRHAERESFGGT